MCILVNEITYVGVFSVFFSDCLVKNRAPKGMCQTHSYAVKGNLHFLRAGLRQQLWKFALSSLLHATINHSLFSFPSQRWFHNQKQWIIYCFFKWLKLKGVVNCGARGSSAAGAECERAAARTWALTPMNVANWAHCWEQVLSSPLIVDNCTRWS